MTLRTVLASGAALAAAACASNPTPAPIHYGGSPAPAAAATAASAPARAFNPYATAPVAPVWGVLHVCGGRVSNPGLVGVSGESLSWRPYISVPSGQLLRNPTGGACLSSGYGYRGTASGGGRQHAGIDLASSSGGYIYAAGAGHVLAAGPRGDYGLSVELDHGFGVRTFYAHLEDINPAVQPGAWAPAGAPIGRMGRTGNATGVHLHYEVSIDGVKIDPLTYGADAAPAAGNPDTAAAF